MRLARRQRNVKRGKRPGSSAISTMTWASSQRPERPNRSRKMRPDRSTSFTKSPLQGKRQSGQRSTRGIDNGLHTPRREQLCRTARNCYKLLSDLQFRGSLAGPAFKSFHMWPCAVKRPSTFPNRSEPLSNTDAFVTHLIVSFGSRVRK